MSRTIRRGKPSRNLHKYISMGKLYHENRVCHGWRWNKIEPILYWKDDYDDMTTYEQYASLKIREYHMDYRPYNKTPSFCFRVEVQRQKRRHQDALHHAIRNGREDELFLERVRQDMAWMWD